MGVETYINVTGTKGETYKSIYGENLGENINSLSKDLAIGSGLVGSSLLIPKKINKKEQSKTSSNKADFYVGRDGAEDTIQSTAYRYMRYKNDDGTINKYAKKTLETKESQGGYFGFENLDNAKDVGDAYQIRLKKHIKNSDDEGSWSDARLKGKFDTLQFYENGKIRKDIRVPRKAGDSDDFDKNKREDLEPFTNYYGKDNKKGKNYGVGGNAQIKSDRNKNIKFDKVEIIKEGE